MLSKTVSMSRVRSRSSEMVCSNCCLCLFLLGDVPKNEHRGFDLAGFIIPDGSCGATGMNTLRSLVVTQEAFKVVYRLAPHGAHEGILIRWNEGFLIGIDKYRIFQPIDRFVKSSSPCR